MLARLVAILSLVVLVGSAIMWFRGEREIRPGPIADARRIDSISLVPLYPGGTAPPGERRGSPRSESSGFDVSEGQHLYRAMNCNGCHQNGGGGIGPALMDDRWIYGSEPAQIYRTILEGRPNGMPSFRNKLTEQQLWQLAAFVRSMSGLVPAPARSAREDHMQSKPPSSLQSAEPPKPGGTVPPGAERPP